MQHTNQQPPPLSDEYQMALAQRNAAVWLALELQQKQQAQSRPASNGNGNGKTPPWKEAALYVLGLLIAAMAWWLVQLQGDVRDLQRAWYQRQEAVLKIEPLDKEVGVLTQKLEAIRQDIVYLWRDVQALQQEQQRRQQRERQSFPQP